MSFLIFNVPAFMAASQAIAFHYFLKNLHAMLISEEARSTPWRTRVRARSVVRGM